MKQILIAVISTLVFSLNLLSQSNIDSILNEIERNNTRLSALRKRADAEKIGNKMGIYLQNPEVGFNYLWGKPSVMGKRTDVSITQSFDFPTAYKYKNQISDIRNNQVDLEYGNHLRTTMLQGRYVCYDLIYINALRSVLSKRLKHAQSIANSYESKFRIGETNILEYNKAQLNLLNIRKELESTEIERTVHLSELTRFNGGIFIDFTDTIFQLQTIPVDFEQWYLMAEKNNLMLSWLKQEIILYQKQEKLNRALSLPKLQAGYMSEKIVGEQFQGVTVGLSIPLWENKNTVKYAKANSLVVESVAVDSKLQFYNQLKALHTKAIGLQESLTDYRINLLSFDHSELLKNALDKGEITLIEYILDFAIYYKSIDKLLELERDMNKTLAELNQYM